MDENPDCPKCHSNLFVQKRGIRPYGAQTYFCRKCKECFQTEYAKRGPKKHSSRPQSLPSRGALSNIDKDVVKWEREEWFEGQSEKSKPIEKIHRPLPSIDSISDVPCFECPLNHCDPRYCEFLDEWLELYKFPLMVFVK